MTCDHYLKWRNHSLWKLGTIKLLVRTNCLFRVNLFIYLGTQEDSVRQIIFWLKVVHNEGDILNHTHGCFNSNFLYIFNSGSAGIIFFLGLRFTYSLFSSFLHSLKRSRVESSFLNITYNLPLYETFDVLRPNNIDLMKILL